MGLLSDMIDIAKQVTRLTRMPDYKVEVEQHQSMDFILVKSAQIN